MQQMGAAFDVERANIRVRDLNGRQDVETKALQASYDGWRQAVSGASLQLAASAGWAAEILSNQKAVEDTQAKVRDAEAELSRVRERRTALSARRDAVADLARLAERHEHRRREEAALDEHAGRATAGWRSA
ncbi:MULTISPECIES: hypothetical protein [Asticcacaulis]|uniref:hypothetical protein n=1 Tax=Asticcacaulis TaxID=76890 RepID=UPI001AE5E5C1|nr:MULTISPECIES: hypothetical protein [Asticcacaulis]MBP2161173.1 hypothetical protein [Asticcacaulis solisilvae]MDR6802218.1 hypothetical protein [Asticcacaulis sp. BE141]